VLNEGSDQHRTQVVEFVDGGTNEVGDPERSAATRSRRDAMGDAVNLDFSDEENAFRADVRSFLESELPSGWTGIWDEGRYVDDPRSSLDVSAAITQRLAEKGWLTRAWPTEYGGQSASVWEQVVLQEEFDAYFEPRGGQYMGANFIGPAIMQFGTDDQKSRYLPEIASGRVQWAQLFSEPDAGSDLASIRTQAYLDGDEFVVNGEKVWTSYANTARHGFLLARSLPGSVRREGLSVLLIDMDAPGVTVEEIPTVLGWHRLHHEYFSGARFHSSCLLGPLHQGWNVTMRSLSLERQGIASYTRATRVLGHLSSMGVEEDELDDLLTLGRMAELIYYSIAAQNESTDSGWLSSALRIIDGWYLQQVADLAEERLGVAARAPTLSAGSSAVDEIEAFCVKRAPVETIAAGTLEVQIGIAARRGLGLPAA